jgi:spore germination cell wall hydrolase CwlJ-like protein
VGSFFRLRSYRRHCCGAVLLIAAAACLSLALYHEARGEPIHGQLMVARVIVNRVASPRWPSSMCGVITQHRQFSFYRKSNAPTPRDEMAWDKAQKLATEIINDPTILPYSTADHYHTPAVRPVWRRKLHRIVRIGYHIFYSYDHPTAVKISVRPRSRRD